MQGPHHILVLRGGQRDIVARKGFGVFCVELEAECPLSTAFLLAITGREREKEKAIHLHQPHTFDQIDAIGEVGRSKSVLSTCQSAQVYTIDRNRGIGIPLTLRCRKLPSLTGSSSTPNFSSAKVLYEGSYDTSASYKNNFPLRSNMYRVVEDFETARRL